jgi:hypothetical protein
MNERTKRRHASQDWRSEIHSVIALHGWPLWIGAAGLASGGLAVTDVAVNG